MMPLATNSRQTNLLCPIRPEFVEVIVPSQSPGIRNLPVASTTSALPGVRALPDGPTASMRSPVMITVIPGLTRPAATSMTVT
jgi:hypothetical protein